jgi:hypothetical protein
LRHLLAVTLLVGCGGTETEHGNDPPPETCVGIALGDACVSAGVPVDGCGVGFEHDGAFGCRPILPAERCPPGLMAVVGETTCREVMACGSGTWGDLPIDGSTQHVDASFTGASDGSALQPWATIIDALGAAAPGALIAVAAGSYAEQFEITTPVRLWGRCPSMVELVGAAGTSATIRVTAVDGVEVGGMAIRGGTRGIASSGSAQLLFDRLWIHDTTLRGISLVDELGPVEATLRASLIEATPESGIGAFGSVLSIESTNIRDSLADAQGTFGSAVVVQNEIDPSTLHVETSVFEGNRDTSVFISGSAATVETTVIRDTQPAANGTFGWAIGVQGTDGIAGELLLRQSVIERSHDVGLYASDSTLIVDATVVRDTRSRAQDMRFGRGINVEMHYDLPSSAVIQSSLVEGNHDAGVIGLANNVTLDNVLVSDTMPDLSTGSYGDGMAFGAAAVSVTSSYVRRSARAGMANFGSSILVTTTGLECNAIDFNGQDLFVPYSYDDAGGNVCGCDGSPIPCKVLTVEIEPPPTLQ